jgi:tetratricopeptide (TPR) repeat protein
MRKRLLIGGGVVLVALACALFWLKPWRSGQPGASEGASSQQATPVSQVAGSASCRPCHERFYQLWSTSHHGLAMQPFTPQLAASAEFAVPGAPVAVKNASYRFEVRDGRGMVRETTSSGTQSYPVVQVMGGKNVFYLLTPLERGRLQVLPVAYDLRQKAWYDTAASAMRHFPDARDQAVDWRDPLYTFNTSCHGCHVSQLSTHYDAPTDSYKTTWSEPGINCETCHGPSSEHVRVCQGLPAGQKPADLKIIVTRSFSADQHNDSCSSCHAKASILTNAFKPADRFYDHFDLVALENPDYYPDGRDLGENYTYTSWSMNSCAAKSKLHCVNCHTSSGRFRFPGEKANQACLPCHEARVREASTHTHHKPDSVGSRCISCHMPMTEFARMRRSDHSFRPPAPAATLAFKSPNACNICHPDRDAAWADRQVRGWHKDDYQSLQIEPARLVDAARKQDWRELPRMFESIAGKSRDAVISASLIRLLNACPDNRKIAVLLRALKDPSPLVRASAASSLEGSGEPEVRDALLAATRDDYRLVRIRAAGALAGYTLNQLAPKDRQGLEAALGELQASYQCRPDDWTAHYNLGNFFSERREYERAVESFAAAARLRKDAVLPRVNAAIAYANLGRLEPAEQSLQQALQLDPVNAAANFNLALLKAEQGDLKQAEASLRIALKSDPGMAAAAYNLGVILARDRREEALQWCGKAAELNPGEPKYAYTLAYYLNEAGRKGDAVKGLQQIVARHANYWDAYSLLGAIYEEQRDVARAKALYRQALSAEQLPAEGRQFFQARLAALP